MGLHPASFRTAERARPAGTAGRGRRVSLAAVQAALGLAALVAVGLTCAGIPPRFTDLARSPYELIPGQPSVAFTQLVASYLLALEVLLAAVFFTAAGLIAAKKPHEPLILFLAIAFIAIGATETGMTDALINPDYGAAGLAWRWPIWTLRAVSVTCALIMLYVLPDGRFVPRWTAPLATIWGLLNLLWLIFPALPFNTVYGPTWRATPVGSFLVGLGWFATGVYAQIHRYRGTADTASRLQARWVMAGLLAVVVGGILSYGSWTIFSYYPLPGGLPSSLFVLARATVATLSLAALPICIALAILRYRLFDIDLILNRALVYAALTASTMAIYLLFVGGASLLVETAGRSIISFLAAGLVAILFQPIRARLQRGVNRLMYGRRDEPVAVLSQLGARLEAVATADEVLPRLAETVAEALKLPYAAIALADESGELEVAAAAGEPASGLTSFPLIYQGRTVGQLEVAARGPGEGFNAADRLLLTNIARQAGAAAHAVRLTAALQRSRQQIVTAREEERRRLRRDLHDGLGPQLASQALTIDAVDRLIERDPAAARALLAHLKVQAQAAVRDIRRLVYDLRPPALDELGLVEALRESTGQYERAGFCITLSELPSPLPPLPAAVEVAAYRIVQEAITNVARHAAAMACHVKLAAESGGLVVSITDDGCGFPPDSHPGVGLTSMRERAEELGGRIAYANQPGGGAQVRAWLPVV